MVGLRTKHDSFLHDFVYVQVALMVAAGSLLIANIKYGGLLMTLSMALLILTRDNPLLVSTDL